MLFRSAEFDEASESTSIATAAGCDCAEPVDLLLPPLLLLLRCLSVAADELAGLSFFFSSTSDSESNSFGVPDVRL